MTTERFTVLDWDTQFFGYKIAKILNSDHPTSLKKDLKEAGVKLAYFESAKPVAEFGAPVVTKRTYIKTPQKHENIARIVTYNEIRDEAQMMDLAIDTGVYSRFKLDPQFPDSDFEKLYLEWMRGSLNQTLADETYVSEASGFIQGFVTIKYHNSYASIGLIGTAPEARGQGVGSNLIKRTENEAIKRNLSTVRVVTQAENLAACKLYEKNGFTIESDLLTYHVWI